MENRRPPKVGDIVLIHGFQSNGAEYQPAIITRIWTDDCINVMVMPDQNYPIPMSSVMRLGSAAIQSITWQRRIDG